MITKILIILVVVAAAFYEISNAFADTANGGFVPPTTRTDGSAITPDEIDGYNVYINGTKDSTLPASAISFTLTLPVGQHSIQLTTIDTLGHESEFSAGYPITVKSPPSAPVIVTITFGGG